MQNVPMSALHRSACLVRCGQALAQGSLTPLSISYGVSVKLLWQNIDVAVAATDTVLCSLAQLNFMSKQLSSKVDLTRVNICWCV